MEDSHLLVKYSIKVATKYRKFAKNSSDVVRHAKGCKMKPKHQQKRKNIFSLLYPEGKPLVTGTVSLKSRKMPLAKFHISFNLSAQKPNIWARSCCHTKKLWSTLAYATGVYRMPCQGYWDRELEHIQSSQTTKLYSFSAAQLSCSLLMTWYCSPNLIMVGQIFRP